MLTTTAAVTNRDNCAGETMDLWGFALACMGYSGSDIVHVCKEATRLARMRSSLGLGSIRRLNPRADDKIESIAQRVMLSNADVWKAIRTTRPQSLGTRKNPWSDEWNWEEDDIDHDSENEPGDPNLESNED
jgi:SpoVK/Ycf46/Vps4 family AAA+-type ATPase